jgi:uncharacterized membrane-anchored protein
MKWFKFIIYFQLFALAAVPVYLLISGMGAAVVAYGLISLALAGFAIYVRRRLAGFRKSALRQYFGLLIANAASVIVYVAVLTLAVGLPVSMLAEAGHIFILAASAAPLLFHHAYFKNRSHLFVN